MLGTLNRCSENRRHRVASRTSLFFLPSSQNRPWLQGHIDKDTEIIPYCFAHGERYHDDEIWVLANVNGGKTYWMWRGHTGSIGDLARCTGS
jgi:hypothetical protein